MKSLYELATGADDWTPDRISRRPAPTPIVPRENLISGAERAEMRKAAADRKAAAVAEILARKAASILAAETARRKREREQREASLAAERKYVAAVKEATLGRLSLIVSEVANDYGLRRDEMRSESRQAHYMAPRSKAAWRMWTECRPSFAQIGRALGRDHSTAIHLIAMYAGPRGLPMPPASANRYKRMLERQALARVRFIERGEP